MNPVDPDSNIAGFYSTDPSYIFVGIDTSTGSLSTYLVLIGCRFDAITMTQTDRLTMKITDTVPEVARLIVSVRIGKK